MSWSCAKIAKLVHVPSYNNLDAYYGVPDADNDLVADPGWLNKHTEVFGLPYPLTASWDHTKQISFLRLNVRIGDSVVDALCEIERELGLDYIMDQRLNVIGDALNVRAMKGSDWLSTHAWGIAIDLNNHVAGWQAPPDSQPAAIVRAFKRRGFTWGGDWDPPYCDPMHFDACGER